MDLHTFAEQEREMMREKLRQALGEDPGEVDSILDLPVLGRWIPELERSAGTTKELEVVAVAGADILRGFCLRYAIAVVRRLNRPLGETLAGVSERTEIHEWEGRIDSIDHVLQLLSWDRGAVERGVCTWVRESGLPDLRASADRLRVSSLADLARLVRLLAYHEEWLGGADGDPESSSWVYNTPAALVSRMEASGLTAQPMMLLPDVGWQPDTGVQPASVRIRSDTLRELETRGAGAPRGSTPIYLAA